MLDEQELRRMSPLERLRLRQTLATLDEQDVAASEVALQVALQQGAKRAALAQILPDTARALDPAVVKTHSDVTRFVTKAMTALHTRAGYA